MNRLVLGVAVLVAVLGCEDLVVEENPVTEIEDPTVIATINDQNITRDHLTKELDQAKRKYRLKKNETLKPEQLLWLKTSTFNEMVQGVLLKQEARRAGVTLSENEFNLLLVQTKQGYDPESFRRALEIEEMSEKEWVEKLRNQMVINKLIQEVVNSKVKVSEQDLKSYYKTHEEDFQKGEQVQALHIMLETEEEARGILKEIEKGQPFSDLARDHSLALEGATGGDMGYFEAGQLPEEFDEIFRLKVDSVSDIIRTPYGFHVFKVIDKKAARKRNFDESRAEIYDLLLKQSQEEAFQNWLSQIRGDAKISINYDVLDQIS